MIKLLIFLLHNSNQLCNTVENVANGNLLTRPLKRGTFTLARRLHSLAGSVSNNMEVTVQLNIKTVSKEQRRKQQ